MPGSTVFWNATLIDSTGRDPQPSSGNVVLVMRDGVVQKRTL